MRIAHLSDLHALDLTGVSWRRFLNKRLTGGVNLLLKRSHQHPIWLFDRLIDAVLATDPDHVVITSVHPSASRSSRATTTSTPAAPPAPAASSTPSPPGSGPQAPIQRPRPGPGSRTSRPT